LFSATMSREIRSLAMSHMVNPKEVLVSKDEPVLDLTKQYYFIADKEVKRDVLCTILDTAHPKAMVFCATKRKTDQLTKKLLAENYPAGAIHGDVAQNKREKVIKAFKEGSIMILVATDVAARGLDISDVDYVFNYDSPMDPDTYVHRIGRTGRAGKEGISVSLFLPEERGMIRDIERRTHKRIDPLEIEVVHRPEPEIKKVLPVQSVPRSRAAPSYHSRPRRQGSSPSNHSSRSSSGYRNE
jgi:ATP-dependent RNA helicase DeaD